MATLRQTPPAERCEYPAIALQPSGLCGTIVRLPAGEMLSMERLPASETAGRFAYLAYGELRCDGESMVQGACIFIAPDEPSLPLTAGAAGAEILLMQFPGAASASESPA